MSLRVSQSQNYKNITSTTTVTTNPGGCYGIFVASASSTPTLKVTDGATTIVNIFTPAGATFYQIPASFSTNLTVTVGGTVDCTVFWS